MFKRFIMNKGVKRFHTVIGVLWGLVSVMLILITYPNNWSHWFDFVRDPFGPNNAEGSTLIFLVPLSYLIILRTGFFIYSTALWIMDGFKESKNER